MTDDDEVLTFALQVEALVEQIRPILAGKPSVIQGGVLADLLATWLAGHMIMDKPRQTFTLREQLLAAHLKVVRLLIPVNENQIMGRPKGPEQ